MGSEMCIRDRILELFRRTQTMPIRRLHAGVSEIRRSAARRFQGIIAGRFGAETPGRRRSSQPRMFFMRRFAATWFLILTVTAPCAMGQDLPAPPIHTEIPFALSETGPEGGFGTQTRGGLDGRVIKVTNLDDEGKGSLRMALEALKGPRTVVFEVSGQINLRRR